MKYIVQQHGKLIKGISETLNTSEMGSKMSEMGSKTQKSSILISILFGSTFKVKKYSLHAWSIPHLVQR